MAPMAGWRIHRDVDDVCERVRVAGERVVMTGGSSYVMHPNAIDSTTMVTDQTGAVRWQVVYGPWGNTLATAGTWFWSNFAGLENSSAAGTDPAAHRFYQPTLGRWLTPDPGGRKVVHLANPQTWNMYTYVTDNPMTLNDPSGLSACQRTNKSDECEVQIVISDRTKDKNGNYNDKFTGIKNEENYNATAKVLVNGKLKGTYLIKTTPSSSKYPTIKAGIYTGTRTLHDNKYPAIRLSSGRYGFSRVPALGGRDPFTKQPYIKNAEIHMSGFGNKTGFTRSGLAVSEGCSVVACSQYPSFESVTGLNAPAPQQDFTIMIGASANGGEE